MFRKISLYLGLFFLTIGLIIVLNLPVKAQTPTPPEPREPGFDFADHTGQRPGPVGAEMTSEGLWYMSAEGHEQPESEAPTTTGGPDEFGYTWDDAVPLAWVDASGGVETGIYDDGDYSGPIDIGFPFKYYENTYSQLYASVSGFLAFNEDYLWNSQSEIPHPEQPNDVIAPHWVPVDYVGGYVRYLQGGTAPNRWFVMEWNRLVSDPSGDSPDEYTFEAILYENGDIIFQYGLINVVGGRLCESSGIEDSTGLDGLSITYFCDPIDSYHAVHIYRPAPSARLRINPLQQGRFTTAGQFEEFTLTVRNTGELGTDAYNLTTSSAWPLTFYHANGNMALTDTNSDGFIDTGPLAQGASMTVIAKMKTPTVVNVGDENSALATVSSTLNPAKSKTVTLQATIPTPFAQAFVDYSDRAMSLYLARPDGQTIAKATDDYYYGYTTALAETPGYVYLWAASYCDDDGCWYNLEYTLLDEQGQTVRPVTTLTDNSMTANYVSESYSSVAVAPNGQIGVTWTRYVYDYNLAQYSYNIYYAILDPAGNVIQPATNLTNVGGGSDGVRHYRSQIVETDDNHFLLNWYRYEPVNGIADTFTAVLDNAGNIIQGPTNRTNNTGNDDSYYSSITPINGYLALLAYTKDIDNNVRYTILDSNGNVVVGETVIPGTYMDWQIDTTRLVNGRILIAWTDYTYYPPRARFVILDPTGQNIVAGPTFLNAAPGAAYEHGMSATYDTMGNAILSWGDSILGDKQFYALVDNNGNVLTQPSIFLQPQSGLPGDLYVNPYADNLAPYTKYPSNAGVDTQLNTASLVAGQPGGHAFIPITFANQGGATATGVTLQLTLPEGVTYHSDTSGLTPTVNGNQVTWNLPALGFLGNGAFSIRVNLPTDTIGTTYPVVLTLTGDQADANPADNTATVQVMLANQIFTPLVVR